LVLGSSPVPLTCNPMFLILALMCLTTELIIPHS
jgi:hypothetical protein